MTIPYLPRKYSIGSFLDDGYLGENLDLILLCWHSTGDLLENSNKMRF
jgi:hypothetical protein